ncbi:MAG: signaling protein [Frankiales bacterium]|jgi:EAL domain-containing protein (putative c-di-GMP-specific phosphodiesterase class I)|nr:signaling protein [Frankiales bacterium]
MNTTAVDLASLHRAATDGSLELVYQPEIDLDSGAIVAMEGLLRWHHGALGVLGPADFLDLAIRTGEISPIGEWVLRTGAAEVATWLDLRGPRRQLWLNVSAEQVRAEGFAELVAGIVRDNDLPNGALGLEVTEKTCLQLGADAEPIFADLHAAGVALAIDDFSSFYATLGAIEALPVDAVKLGHNYVRGVGNEDHDDVLVASVIERAHARGMYVVAEGVEEWSEHARLIELGCDRAHGWLFASAQRADKARWLMAQGMGWRVGGDMLPLPTQRAHH